MNESLFTKQVTINNYFTRRLLSIHIVNRSVTGLYPAIKFLGRKHKSIQLRLRDDLTLLCPDKYNAYGHCLYYFLGKLLGVYSQSELLQIDKLSKLIEQSLAKVFNEKELRSSAGASPYFNGRLFALYVLIRYLKPKIVVQTGVASGVSSSLILLALKNNEKGKLIDIDLPNRQKGGYQYNDGTIDKVFTPEGFDPGWVIPQDLRERWVLHLGASKEILSRIGECDVFYHDSEHSYENMMFEYQFARSCLSHHGILASDDIDWNHAWKDFHNKNKNFSPLFGDLSLGVSQKN